MIDLQDPQDRAASAGEYVLGAMDADDAAAFEAALADDADLQAAVYGWQDRLLPLSAHAAAANPRPQLWQRIEAAIAAMPGAAAPARREAPQPSWWQRLGWWQGISAVAVAASLLVAVLVTVLLAGRAPEAEAARYLAVLQSPQTQSAGWIVELQAGGSLRLVPIGDTGPVPAGRAWQFWTKPQGAAGPTSLGLVRAGQTLVLPASRLPGIGPQQLFEITLEPENGSPLDRPTGPILYLGRTVAL